MDGNELNSMINTVVGALPNDSESPLWKTYTGRRSKSLTLVKMRVNSNGMKSINKREPSVCFHKESSYLTIIWEKRRVRERWPNDLFQMVQPLILTR